MIKIITLAFFIISFNIKAVDLNSFREKHLVKPFFVYNFKEKGFGFYDIGDDKLKVFNWSFELLFSFPIKKGSSPGDLRQNPYPTDVIFTKNSVYVALSKNNIINIYNKQGKFNGEIKTNLAPQMLINKGNSIYIYNGNIDFKNELTTLRTSYSLKKYLIESPLVVKGLQRDKKELFKDIGNIQVSSLPPMYSLDNKGNVILLDRLKGRLFIINELGVILKKIILPIKDNFKIVNEKEGNRLFASLKVISFYFSMITDNEDILLAVGKNITERKKASTVFYRLKKDESIKEKEIKGKWLIVGTIKNVLLIFNRDKYNFKIIKI